jgi:AraC-like DNA-binding protein
MKPILEQIDLRRGQSILAFRHLEKNFETPWHFHPQHELTYIEESVGTKFVGDYVGAYEPGELVLLRSNLPHCWKNHTNQPGQSISTVVQWNKGIFSKVPELSPLFEMLSAASKGILFDKEESLSIIPQLKDLPTLNGPTLYLQLLEVLMDLTRCSYRTLSEASFTDDLPSEYGNRMATVHGFIEKNYGRKIYLKEMADLVNMSEQSFSRFFSKMMGRPFFTFLNEYRINMASRMLIDTDWAITEIGYQCGYDSPSFFNKQFNKFKNTSPLRYRGAYK